VNIVVNGKQKYIGLYADKSDAVKARDAADKQQD